MLLGCIAVYGALFSAGFFIYGRAGAGLAMGAAAAACTIGIFKIWPKLSFH